MTVVEAYLYEAILILCYPFFGQENKTIWSKCPTVASSRFCWKQGKSQVRSMNLAGLPFICPHGVATQNLFNSFSKDEQSLNEQPKMSRHFCTRLFRVIGKTLSNCSSIRGPTPMEKITCKIRHSFKLCFGAVKRSSLSSLLEGQIPVTKIKWSHSPNLCSLI